MQKLLWVLVLLGLVAAQVEAQTVITQPGGTLVWDQETSSTDTVLPSAYTFQLVVGTQPPVAVTGTCTKGTGTVWTCRTPLPSLPNGTYEMKVIASAVADGKTQTSAPSAALTLVYQTITFIIKVPTNLRIEPGGGQ